MWSAIVAPVVAAVAVAGYLGLTLGEWKSQESDLSATVEKLRSEVTAGEAEITTRTDAAEAADKALRAVRSDIVGTAHDKANSQDFQLQFEDLLYPLKDCVLSWDDFIDWELHPRAGYVHLTQKHFNAVDAYCSKAVGYYQDSVDEYDATNEGTS